MANYESVFLREFNTMMNERKSRNTSFAITDIPCPDMRTISKDIILKDSYVLGGKKAIVKGIVEPGYSQLNKTEVEVVSGRTFKKRLFLKKEDGTVGFRLNSDGSVVTKEVNLAKGFVAVYSPINLKLNNRERHTFGYEYIDFVEYTKKGYVPGQINSRNKRMYLYAIPMECVYVEDLCALVISLNKHKAYYKGVKVALTNGHSVYIYSIPYKYRENTGYYMLGAKASPNFDLEMKYLLNYWMQHQILFDLNLTSLQSQVKGVINLGIQDIPGTCDVSSFSRITKPLKNLDILEE